MAIGRIDAIKLDSTTPQSNDDNIVDFKKAFLSACGIDYQNLDPDTKKQVDTKLATIVNSLNTFAEEIFDNDSFLTKLAQFYAQNRVDNFDIDDSSIFDTLVDHFIRSQLSPGTQIDPNSELGKTINILESNNEVTNQLTTLQNEIRSLFKETLKIQNGLENKVLDALTGFKFEIFNNKINGNPVYVDKSAILYTGGVQKIAQKQYDILNDKISILIQRNQNSKVSKPYLVPLDLAGYIIDIYTYGNDNLIQGLNQIASDLGYGNAENMIRSDKNIGKILPYTSLRDFMKVSPNGIGNHNNAVIGYQTINLTSSSDFIDVNRNRNNDIYNSIYGIIEKINNSNQDLETIKKAGSDIFNKLNGNKNYTYQNFYNDLYNFYYNNANIFNSHKNTGDFIDQLGSTIYNTLDSIVPKRKDTNNINKNEYKDLKNKLEALNNIQISNIDIKKRDIRGINRESFSFVLLDYFGPNGGGASTINVDDFKAKYLNKKRSSAIPQYIPKGGMFEIQKIVDIINLCVKNENAKNEFLKIADIGIHGGFQETYNMQLALSNASDANNIFSWMANFDFNDQVNSLNSTTDGTPKRGVRRLRSALGLSKDENADRDFESSFAGLELYDMLVLYCDVDNPSGNFNNRQIKDGPNTSKTLYNLLKFAQTRSKSHDIDQKIEDILSNYSPNEFPQEDFVKIMKLEPSIAILIIQGLQIINETGNAAMILRQQSNVDYGDFADKYIDPNSIDKSSTGYRTMRIALNQLQTQYFTEKVDGQKNLIYHAIGAINLLTDTFIKSNGIDATIGFLAAISSGTIGGTLYDAKVKEIRGRNQKQIKDALGNYIMEHVGYGVHVGTSSGGDVAVLSISTEKLSNDLMDKVSKFAGLGITIKNPFSDPTGSFMKVNINLGYAKARGLNEKKVNKLGTDKIPPINRFGIQGGAFLNIDTKQLLQSNWDLYVGLFLEKDYTSSIEKQVREIQDYMKMGFKSLLDNGPNNPYYTILQNPNVTPAEIKDMIINDFRTNGYNTPDNKLYINTLISEIQDMIELYDICNPNLDAKTRLSNLQALAYSYMFALPAMIEQKGYNDLSGDLKLTKIGVNFSLKDLITHWSGIGVIQGAKNSYQKRVSAMSGAFGKSAVGALARLAGGGIAAIVGGLKSIFNSQMVGLSLEAKLSTFNTYYYEDAKKTLINYEAMNRGYRTTQECKNFEITNDKTTTLNNLGNALLEQLQVPGLTVSTLGDKAIVLQGNGLQKLNIRVANSLGLNLFDLEDKNGKKYIAYNKNSGKLVITPEFIEKYGISIFHQLRRDNRETYLVLGSDKTMNTVDVVNGLTTEQTNANSVNNPNDFIDFDNEDIEGLQIPQALDYTKFNSLISKIKNRNISSPNGIDDIIASKLKNELFISDGNGGFRLKPYSQLPNWAKDSTTGGIISHGTLKIIWNDNNNDGNANNNEISFVLEDANNPAKKFEAYFVNEKENENLKPVEVNLKTDFVDYLDKKYNATKLRAEIENLRNIKSGGNPNVIDLGERGTPEDKKLMSQFYGFMYDATLSAANDPNEMRNNYLKARKILLNSHRTSKGPARQQMQNILKSSLYFELDKSGNLKDTPQNRYKLGLTLNTLKSIFAYSRTTSKMLEGLSTSTIGYLMNRRKYLFNTITSQYTNYPTTCKPGGSLYNALYNKVRNINNYTLNPDKDNIEEQADMIGFGAFYRTQSRGFSLNTIGDAKCVYYKENGGQYVPAREKITDDKDKILAKNFVKEQLEQYTGVELQYLIDMLNHKIYNSLKNNKINGLGIDEKTQFIKDYTDLNNIIDGKSIEVNGLTLSISTSFYFYLMGECTNEAIGMEFEQINLSIKGKKYIADVEPDLKGGIQTTTGTYTADYDIGATQRDINLIGRRGVASSSSNQGVGGNTNNQGVGGGNYNNQGDGNSSNTNQGG